MQMAFHAVLRIHKPPGSTELNTALHTGILLEAAGQRLKGIKVFRIQRIENHLRAPAGHGQIRQKTLNSMNAVMRIHGIKARIRAKQMEVLLIGVAQRIVVQLHRNIARIVHAGKLIQQPALPVIAIRFADRFPCHCLAEHFIGTLLIVPGSGMRNRFNAVIRSAAAHAYKEVETLFQCSGGIGCTVDLHACRFPELLHIAGKGRLLNIQCQIRTEGGRNDRRKAAVFSELLMPLKRVSRIIGRTDEADAGRFYQAAAGAVRIILQHVIGLIPDLLRIGTADHILNAEILAQFQLAPVIHRISDRLLQCFAEVLEPLTVRRITGNVFFGNTVGTHQPPLIVIAIIVVAAVFSLLMTAKPYLCQIGETRIFIDILGRNVAMIINDRKILRI